MPNTQSPVCEEPDKRASLRKAGQVIVATAVLPTLGLAIPKPAHAAFWLLPTVTFFLGYGLTALLQRAISLKQERALLRLRDRMGAIAWPGSVGDNSLRVYLGGAYDTPGTVTLLKWPEFGYHDAKVKEGAGYRHPTSPPERLALSDREIFQEALRARVPGLMNSRQAYARDYVDREGNELRIVAAQLPGGQTYVAESDGRDVQSYEVEVHGS